MITYGHFVGGQPDSGTPSRFVCALEPMTGEVRSGVALASRSGVRAAVQNAVGMVGVPAPISVPIIYYTSAGFSYVSQHRPRFVSKRNEDVTSGGLSGVEEGAEFVIRTN